MLARTPEKVLRGVHPNIGLQQAFKRKLLAMIARMHDSIMYWLQSSYKQNKPRLALDESPAAALAREIRRLTRQWVRNFDKMAGDLSKYFATAVEKRSSNSLRQILKDGGFTVEFKMTPAMHDIVTATVHESVSLIKSIPRRYMQDVNGIVMRSVQAGRDLGQLAQELQTRLGVTKRRAALIARDQNNKATAAFTRARNLEVGIEESVWLHSAGGKEPRPSHVKAGREGVRYRNDRGWFDPVEKQWIFPGQLINCRCVGKPVIKGFS